MGGQPLPTGVATVAYRQVLRNNKNHHQMERKLKKPLMEKKRRARINRCLVELKHILLQNAPHQRSKLEKADILEMTVQYLRHKNDADLRLANRFFHDGFRQCADAVVQYFSKSSSSVADGLPTFLSTYLNDHLLNVADRRRETVGGVLRPIPLTLNIPSTQSSTSLPQLLPTPPFTAGVAAPTLIGNVGNFSPAPSCSSSESSAGFFSFSPSRSLSTNGGKTPTNVDKLTVGVWRPW